MPAVSEASAEHLLRLAEWSAYFRVATEPADGGERVIGFLMAMTPESAYPSPNFRWFADAYDRFVYVDRIVVDPDHRGRGIGVLFYRDVEDFTRPLAPRVTCEVNTRPMNEGSLRFHHRLGFREVGTQETEGGKKAVSLLEKRIRE